MELKINGHNVALVFGMAFVRELNHLAGVATKEGIKNSGKEGTYDLRSNSVTNLTERQDIFLTKHVTVTTESSSSSGGSSGGSSSGGGGSSGGGSRSF